MIRSIQMKIAIASGASLLVTLLVVIGFSARSVHVTSMNSATAQVRTLVQMEAKSVSGEMTSVLESARTLALTYSGIKDYENTLDIGREEATNMLASLLGHNPAIAGVFTLWEPDAFDGMDLGFADTAGHDASGRFAPYWYLNDDGAAIAIPFLDSEEHAPEGRPAAWYDRARESRTPQLGEPVWTEQNGAQRLISSICVPIIANDIFYGVVGVDLDLDYAQDLVTVDDIFDRFGGEGEIVVFSHGGTIVAHRTRPELRGQFIDKVHPDWEEDLEAIQNGVDEYELMESDLEFFTPVLAMGSELPWSVNIVIAEASISPAAMALTWKLISVGALLLLCSLGAIWYLAGRISKPLRTISGIAREIAQGNLDQSVDVNDATEVGQLADSFRHMQEALKAKVEAAREIAGGNLDVDIDISSDHDVLGQAMQTVKENLDSMDSDLRETIGAMKSGQLDERCEPSNLQGSYRDLLAGVNEALDAVIVPLRMAGEHVDSLSKGCMPPQIDETYAGEYDTIKDNLNSCVAAMQAMSMDVGQLAQACQNGQLDSRADANRHQGDYRKIIQGFNGTLDAVVTPLKRNADVMAQIAIGQVPDTMDEAYQGDFEAIKQSLNECIGAINQLAEDSQELMESAALGHLEKRAEANRHKGDFRTIIAGFNETLDAVIHPFNEAAFILERVSQRDLIARMDGEYMGDFSKFKEMLNSAVENLDQSMLQVEMASVQIDTATQSLAQGASTQAASLQEISHNLKELTSSSQQNTSNAQEAQNIAKSAVNSTQTGVSSMERLSQAIDRIKASSDETAKIVKTIDEIAFQTNLLALNAAVEAARAGEAGKGFAVVAEEVRNLAIRSAEAAKNTSAMIEEAERNAEDGVKINKEVLDNLGEIDDQISRVGEMMSEIAVSSESQSEDVAMITGAIDQFNSITQENAASSEESASAAQELAAQAAEMRKMVAEFEITKHDSEVPLPAPQPAFDPSNEATSTVDPGMNFEAPSLPAPQPEPAQSPASEDDPRIAIPLDDDDMKLLSDF